MTGNYEVFQFPPLFKTMSSGKVRFWELVIHHYAHESHIVAKYGFTDGKVTDTKPTILTQGKNIGKANETSIREQAFLEAQSKWNLKVKRSNFTSKVKEVKPNRRRNRRRKRWQAPKSFVPCWRTSWSLPNQSSMSVIVHSQNWRVSG